MKKFLIGIMSFALPAVALAQINAPQTAGSGTTATTILGDIQGILDILIPILITIAVIIFIVGVMQYILATDDTKKKEGRDRMIYGIIGLFVILSIFGIIAVLGDTVGIGQGGNLRGAIPEIR